VHILQKEIWPGDPERAERLYREMLMFNFGERSAADLGEAELEELVRIMEDRKTGGRPRTADGRRSRDARVEELRDLANDLKNALAWPEKRLRGLVYKICGVSDIAWCSDIKKLDGLVKALENYLRDEFSTGD